MAAPDVSGLLTEGIAVVVIELSIVMAGETARQRAGLLSWARAVCGMVPPSVNSGAVNPQPSPSRHRTAGWAKLGTGLVILAGEAAEGALHPALADTLAIADLVIPVACMLVVFAVITRGSEQTCDRVFRFLRWIANRPEPPAPGSSQPPAPGSHASSWTAD
jgi:hypothetical protein